MRCPCRDGKQRSLARLLGRKGRKKNKWAESAEKGHRPGEEQKKAKNPWGTRAESPSANSAKEEKGGICKMGREQTKKNSGQQGRERALGGGISGLTR